MKQTGLQGKPCRRRNKGFHIETKCTVLFCLPQILFEKEIQSEQEILGKSSGCSCHASLFADCFSMCKTCEGNCASGVLLDAHVDVTVFGRKHTNVAITQPDCERRS